jgi:carbonic anhydrase
MPFHDHRTMAACACTGVAASPGRRNFLRLAALGAGAALMGLSPRPAAAGQTDALLLSCMDYRLVDDITRYMDGRGMADKYDHIILAGASLGAVTSKFPAWNQTFWEHLDVAIKLHHIHKVFVMDHRDCGAYRVVFNYDYAQDRAAERKIHAETLHALRAAIQQRHEAIKEIELLLMGVDGKVETVEI